jgi:hypothetical protein
MMSWWKLLYDSNNETNQHDISQTKMLNRTGRRLNKMESSDSIWRHKNYWRENFGQKLEIASLVGMLLAVRFLLLEAYTVLQYNTGPI